MIVSGLVCFILSNFISNTATAALLIPILTVVCAGMGDKLNTIGGTSTILIGVAVSASCAMSLPISTPPNAIAYSTGLIQQTDMATPCSSPSARWVCSRGASSAKIHIIIYIKE
ncbi:transporter%2C divalent anion:Na+ symporter (DASS) family [Segatella copri]|nr:transporter%2C divalent anion:Na+ symporter (DASS) family [Segatella copri]